MFWSAFRLMNVSWGGGLRFRLTKTDEDGRSTHPHHGSLVPRQVHKKLKEAEGRTRMTISHTGQNCLHGAAGAGAVGGGWGIHHVTSLTSTWPTLIPGTTSATSRTSCPTTLVWPRTPSPYICSASRPSRCPAGSH